MPKKNEAPLSLAEQREIDDQRNLHTIIDQLSRVHQVWDLLPYIERYTSVLITQQKKYGFLVITSYLALLETLVGFFVHVKDHPAGLPASIVSLSVAFIALARAKSIREDEYLQSERRAIIRQLRQYGLPFRLFSDIKEEQIIEDLAAKLSSNPNTPELRTIEFPISPIEESSTEQTSLHDLIRNKRSN